MGIHFFGDECFQSLRIRPFRLAAYRDGCRYYHDIRLSERHESEKHAKPFLFIDGCILPWPAHVCLGRSYCLIMAAPVGLLFTYIGYRIGYWIIRGKMGPQAPSISILLILTVPALMAFENIEPSTDDLRSVTTTTEINASPAVVWKNVIEFPPLNPPSELIFKAGIAYPINAKIDGTGVGAIRHCNFQPAVSSNL